MIPKIARWTVLTAIFVLPFLALYTSGSMYFPFITGKNFLFRILVEFAAVAWIVLALADKKYRPRFSWTFAFFALLIVWMAIADASAVNAHKAFWSNYERMDGWVTLVHVFLFFVVAGSVLSADKLWRSWSLTFIAASALVALDGIGQMLGITAIHQSATRIDATLGNAEYLAGFLLFAIGITLWQAFETKREQAWLRYTLYVLVVLDLVILFKTGTRGSFVGLVAALVAGALLWLAIGKDAGAKSRKAATMFIAALVVLGALFFGVRHASFIQNDPNLARIANISVKELGTRTLIWKMAVEGIKERPVTGWGEEGFNYVFNKYYEPAMYAQEPWFDRAHSLYLDYAIAGGIPALALFLALFLSAFVAVYRSRELSARTRILILATLVGYAVQGIVVFDNLFTYIPLAFLLAFAHDRKARPIPAFERMPEFRGSSIDVVIAPIALIVALALVYTVNVPSMEAASDLIYGLTPTAPPQTRLHYFQSALSHGPFATQEIREQLLMFAGQAGATQNLPDQTRQEILQYADAQIREELARAPQDARLYALYASFLRNAGQFDAARAASARAHELSPNKQTIIVEQGIEAWQAHDYPGARQFFTEAYNLDTSDQDTATYAGIGLILTGDVAGGKSFFAQHVGTSTPDDIILALAYQEIKDWDDMIAVLRVHAQAQGDATSGFQLALAYAQAGRFAEARTQVQAVAAAHPEAAEQANALLAQLKGK